MKIQLETAKLLKEKGFEIKGNQAAFLMREAGLLILPRQDEVQKWLREEHGIHLYADWYWHESDGYVYTFDLSYVPKEFADAKRRVSHVVRINSYSAYGAVYDGGFDTYEQALEAGLQKALTLI